MAGELTGTARAYTRCGSCGHARQRHRRGGTGACVQVVMVKSPMTVTSDGTWPFPCRCPRFTELTESE